MRRTLLLVDLSATASSSSTVTPTTAPIAPDQASAAIIHTSTDRSTVERQPHYFVTQFTTLFVLFALTAIYMRHTQRAALKGNMMASRRIVLPALEPLVWALTVVSVIFAAAFAVALATQNGAENVSELVNEAAFAGKQFILLAALAHMAQRHFSTRTIQSCILLALVLSCYSVPVVWRLGSADAAFTSTWAYVWTLSGTRALVLLFYAKLTLWPPRDRASRSSIREYCAFAVTALVLAVATDAVSKADAHTSADAFAYASLVWTSLSPLFIWRMARADTEHWRGVGAHTCELHRQLMLELKTHSTRTSHVQNLEDRVSPQGLHLRIEMQPKLVLDVSALEIKQRSGKSSVTRMCSGVLHSRTAVAVKMYSPADFADETLARLAHEAALRGALHHPNIVRFYGMCVTPPTVNFVTELCAATLEDALHAMAKHIPTTTPHQDHRFLVQLANILDIARAVAYMHSFSPAFVHGAIEPRKFGIDHEGNIKLMDLGESTRLPRQRCNSDDLGVLESGFNAYRPSRSTNLREAAASIEANSVGYMAPEALYCHGDGDASREARSNEAVDIYALAMVMWDVFHPDWERFPGLQASDSVVVARAVTSGYRPKIDLRIRADLRQLIESAWHHDARLRPSAQYIVSVLETIQEEVMQSFADELFSDLDNPFFGEAAVQHLTQSRRVQCRAQAIRLGNALMDAGLLHHVNHSKGFEVGKYGVYYIDDSRVAVRERDAHLHNNDTSSPPARLTSATTATVAAALLDTTTSISTSTPPRPSTRAIEPKIGDTHNAVSPPALRATRGHRVESFERDQLRLVDSTLCACRRLGQHMEEPAKLVRRTRRPTPRLLEEENSLTAELLTATHASV